MNSFQYAIAKAAWQAYHEATHEAPLFGGFDKLGIETRRAWLAAAIAVLDTASKYASGWQR
jgi:hypothetical protein